MENDDKASIQQSGNDVQKPEHQPPSKSSVDQENSQPNLVPSTNAYPVVPVNVAESPSDRSVLLINPSVMESLAQDEPAKVLEYAEESDKRRFIYYKTKEDNRHRETISAQISIQNTVRIVSFFSLSAIVAAFIYAGITRDGNLPDKMFSYLSAGFGGAGIMKVFGDGGNKRSNRDED